MKKLLLLIFIFPFFYTLQAQQIAKGYIFDDTNKNGKKERKEKGLEKVSVSNGRDVVFIYGMSHFLPI